MRSPWQEAVVYEVYLRSFADSDGDGIGDLRGLIERLDHVASVADALWLTPFQPSPQVDNGYDVADYTGVDPLFGDEDDFAELMEKAHALGLGVIVDVVPNHCSREHPAFQAAVAAGPGGAERGLFLFRRGAEDGRPPNNWTSVFGGPAWSRANPGSDSDDEWYLHLFDEAQPDWNWEHPEVHRLFEHVLRYWFERGVDGIRVDVAHALYKAPGLPDAPAGTTVIDGLRTNPQVCDQEPVHNVYRAWRSVADEFEPPRLLVGEVNLAPDRAARFARPGELHQTFPFGFVNLPWDAHAWATAGSSLEQASRVEGAQRAWALENHDIVRTVTRYGGGVLGTRRARAALVALLGLPGTAYLFQGQELGLPEVDVPEGARRDPMWSRAGVSRDGARVPLPWTSTPQGGHGFSSVAGADPWLPQPAGWGGLSIEQQAADPDSVLNLVRRALAARKSLSASLSETDALSWEVTPAGGLCITRGERLRIIVAMGEEDEPLTTGSVLLASHPLLADRICRGTAAWVMP